MDGKIKFEFIDWRKNRTDAWGKFIVMKIGDSLLLRAQQVEHHIDISTKVGDTYYNENIVAAGKFTRDGLVTEWESTAYEVRTPLELQSPIRDVFIAHAVEIAKKWQKYRASV